MNQKYHNTLAEYFSAKSLYHDGPSERKPNIRKLVEQPWQNIKVENWDEAVDILCNIQLVEAFFRAQLSSIINDYYAQTLLLLPESQPYILLDRERKLNFEKWLSFVSTQMASNKGYAGKDHKTLKDNRLPSCKILSKKRIINESDGKEVEISRRDKIILFHNFIRVKLMPLQYFSNIKGFTAQIAFNHSATGILHDQAKSSLNSNLFTLLVKHWDSNALSIFYPAITTVIEVTEKKYWDEDYIYDIAITPDGKYGISFGLRTTNVWNLENGFCLATINSVPEIVGYNKYDKWEYYDDLKSLPENAAKIIDMKTQGGWSTYVQLDERLNRASYKRKYNYLHQIFGGNLKTVDGKYLLKITDHQIRIVSSFLKCTVKKLYGDISCISITPDNRLALTGDKTGLIKLWNLAKGFNEKIYEVNNFHLTTNKSKLLYTDNKNNIVVIDVLTEKKLFILTDHRKKINCIRSTHDGKFAVSGGQDLVIILWDLRKGKRIMGYMGHHYPIADLLFTQDDKILISIDVNDDLCIWELATGKLLYTQRFNFGKFIEPPGYVKLNNLHDVWIFITKADSSTFILNLRDKYSNLIISKVYHSGIVRAQIRFSTDSSKAAIIYAGSTYFLEADDFNNKYRSDFSSFNFNCQESYDLSPLGQVIEGYADCISFSSDGQKMVLGKSGSLIILSCTNPVMLLNKIEIGNYADISSAGFSHSGKYILSVSLDHYLKIWDALTGGLTYAFKYKGKYQNFASFSPNDRFAACYSDHYISVIDIENLDTAIYETQNIIRGVHFSQTNNLIINEEEKIIFIDLPK